MLAAIGIGLVCCGVQMLAMMLLVVMWHGVVWMLLTIYSLVTRLNFIWQRPENVAHLLVLKLL